MASLINEKNGTHRICFAGPDKRRRTLRLGKMPKRAAETVFHRVGFLISAQASRTAVDPETATWLSSIGDDLHDRIARVGLAAERGSTLPVPLRQFLQGVIDHRTDLKPNTRRNWGMSRDRLVEYFSPERDIRTITCGDADEWRENMVNQGYAVATISKHVKQARQFFKRAQRKGLIPANPFSEVATGSQANEGRCHFIDRATIAKVLDACPHDEWRLIIALARYGGLRTPSETLALQWSDIDWEHNRIVVPSPKTAHQGKPYRTIPLFPEVRPYLEQLFFNPATDGKQYCIEQFRDAVNQNLRTQLMRILKRAGVAPWPRLFHNLRASRIMELADKFPGKVVADWTGNTERISQAHYQKATEEHFQRATESDTELTAKRACTPSEKLARNPAQLASEPLRQSQEWSPSAQQKTPELPGRAKYDVTVQTNRLPPRGFEPRLPD